MSAPDAGTTGAGITGGRPADAPPTTGDRRADIAADIDRARARVAASLSTLGQEVARRGDWRAWVRDRPGLVLGAALTLGFIWGGGGQPRSDR